MSSRRGELLTRTGGIVRQWKENFEELPNPNNTSSVKEAEIEDSEEVSPIFLAEVVEVVKKLLSGKALGVNEIHLKALHIVGLSWLVGLFCVKVGHSSCGVAGRGGHSHF